MGNAQLPSSSGLHAERGGTAEILARVFTGLDARGPVWRVWFDLRWCGIGAARRVCFSRSKELSRMLRCVDKSLSVCGSATDRLRNSRVTASKNVRVLGGYCDRCVNRGPNRGQYFATVSAERSCRAKGYGWNGVHSRAASWRTT